jgi:cytochrome c biogenesis protein CcdA
VRRGVGRPIRALLLALTLAVLTLGAAAPSVEVTLYYGEGCPHCAAEIQFLRDELLPAHPEVAVTAYEVWYDQENLARMVEDSQRLGFEAGVVPVTIVGDEVFVGFGEQTGAQLTAAVERAAEGETAPPAEPLRASGVLSVPLLGEVDLAGSSLVASTLLIGLVDGINPCSLWVLSVLLALVLHSGSRRRVLAVGSTFLVVTSAMYALYVAGLYTALDYLSGLTWIRVMVAGVAVTFGVLQLLDALAPGRAPSLSIPAQRRPGLYRRMRAVSLQDRGVVATLAGTVTLAVGVSLLETPCTAGLPLLWTSLLAERQVGTTAALGLFGLYMLVFLVDELVVFAVAVLTLRAAKIQERHGRALKLVAGSLLVTLAVAMLAVPQALQTLGGSLAVFATAALLAALLALLPAQPRRQRVSSVPSSASSIPAGENPTGGSAPGPSAMRRT